jgi:putative phage-type endonuclease
MNRDQWLKDRMSGIGGSDAPAVLGLSKWKTPLQVYLEKRGELGPQPESEPMRWGTRLEPIVRQEYADRTGEVVRMPEGLLRHAAHPWMLATVDGIADSGRLVEIKTARTADGWGEPGTDEVPQAYLIQVQHYLAVTALPVADVAVLIGGQDFRLYHVPADRELQDLIIEQEAEFWQAVQKGTPPNPVSYADVVARYGRASREGTVRATDEALEALAALRLLKTERDELDAEEEKLKAIVFEAFGEFDTLVANDGHAVATWKATKPRQSLDAEALKAAHPAIYAQFLKTGAASRRFLIK